MACFAFRFPLLSSLVLLSLVLLLGFVACFPAWLLLLVFGSACVVVVGFLSLSDGFRYKKKGRKGFAPCVLSSCVVVSSFTLLPFGCYSLILLP